MTGPNILRALRAFNRRRPFRPFLLEFFTGERLLITHPEAVSFDGDLLVFITPTNEKYRVFDCDSICQIMDDPG